jgi:hypothetical protein
MGTPALPHGHVGEHVIEQVGGSLGHPAAAATGTKRAAFTGKRDQAVQAAVAAARPREPAGEPATLQKGAELLLDEAGQAFPVAQAGGLRAKGLEVIVHDLVERTRRGTPRFVARRGRGHSRPEGGRRASNRSRRCGLNRLSAYAAVAIYARRAPRTRGRIVSSHRRELPTWQKNIRPARRRRSSPRLRRRVCAGSLTRRPKAAATESATRARLLMRDNIAHTSTR